jgi:hypothetical protein
MNGEQLRFAFLILMHKNPEQVVRLVERLDGPQSSFFIHVDARASNQIYSHIARFALTHSNVACVQRHRCHWGDFGIVAGTLECIRAALAGEYFDRALLLSGQDYPIKPLDGIFEYISKYPDAEFIEAFPLDAANRWTGKWGYVNATARYEWYILRFRRTAFPIPMKRRPPLKMTPSGGSQWWCLSNEALRYVVQFVDRWPSVMKYFRNVSIPDETVFQTIIYNSPFRRRIICDDLHFAAWEKRDARHPAILRETNMPLMQDSNKLLARKFDLMKHPLIFDLIDRELLQIAPRD